MKLNTFGKFHGLAGAVLLKEIFEQTSGSLRCRFLKTGKTVMSGEKTLYVIKDVDVNNNTFCVFGGIHTLYTKNFRYMPEFSRAANLVLMVLAAEDIEDLRMAAHYLKDAYEFAAKEDFPYDVLFEYLTKRYNLLL